MNSNNLNSFVGWLVMRRHEVKAVLLLTTLAIVLSSLVLGVAIVPTGWAPPGNG